MAEKKHSWRKVSITANPKEEARGLKEDYHPITEELKENPFNEKPKEDPYYCET